MLSVEQRLYVDVTLEAKDPEVVLNVQRCWATPTTEADAPVRHTLIYEGCPTDPTVVLRDDAPDANSARWESQMFQFVDEAQVWLHCDIQACDSRRFSCENTCEDRERREIQEIFSGSRHPRAVSTPNASGTGMYNPNILTVGPLRSQERWADSTIGKYSKSKLDSFKSSFLNKWKSLFGSSSGSQSSFLSYLPKDNSYRSYYH